ncbi:hypothetical protein [Spiroplasma endosymbiont of Cleonymus obscurus]
MQNYFAEKTKPVTSNKQQAIVNVTDSLKKIQKNEYLTKSIRRYV